MTDLLEVGGYVDIVCTPLADFTVNGRNYHKGDVILNLSNVYANLAYKNYSSVASGKNNQVDYYDYTLSSVSIPFSGLEQQLFNLFGNGEDTTHEVLHVENCDSFGGRIILKGTDIIADSIICRDANFTAAQANGITMLIGDFQNNTKYEVQYKTLAKGYTFLLDSQSSPVPYVTMQIKARGNKDKYTATTYIFVSKANIHYSTTMNFNNTSVSYGKLSFSVLDDRVKPIVLVLHE